MKLDREQLLLISKYFSDISKVLFVSIVLGFLIPSESIHISSYMFIGGSIATVFSFVFSVNIIKQRKL
jgi:hypothetical protein